MKPGCPRPDVCELFGCQHAPGCGQEPPGRLTKLVALLPDWAKPLAPAAEPELQLTEEMLVSETVHVQPPTPAAAPPIRPAAAPAPAQLDLPTKALRIAPIPGFGNAGAGFVIGLGDSQSPLAVAGSEEQLLAVVRAWSRGG